MLELSRDTKVDRIIAYLAQDDTTEMPVKLTEQELEHLTRMSYTDSQLRRGYPPRTVANMLMRKYINPKTGQAISQATAYRIIHDCQVGFGGTSTFQVNYWKQLAHEMIMDLYRMAKADNNLRSMATAIKELKSLLALNSEDGNKIPADALNRIDVYLVGNPEAVGLQRVSLEDIETLYAEVMGKTAPKVLDITDEQR